MKGETSTPLSLVCFHHFFARYRICLGFFNFRFSFILVQTIKGKLVAPVHHWDDEVKVNLIQRKIKRTRIFLTREQFAIQTYVLHMD